MAAHEASMTPSPEGMLEDNVGSSSESIRAQQENSGANQRPSTSATDASTSSLQPGKQTTPMPKRRRVTRACDECRRKKIKCDGRQPCTHCTVYSYECTYDQPSNRRRNPAPQYIEALETRLQKTEAILRIVAPDIDIDDPKFDALLPHQILASRKGSQDAATAAEAKLSASVESGDESLLESMMENTGTLDLDDQGHWDYHGQSSSVLFMRRFREQFKDLKLTDPLPKARSALAQVMPPFDSPFSLSDSPKDGLMTSLQDLPSKELAEELCKNALNQACSLMRFIHQPSFWRMFSSIYDKPAELHGNEENKFLPLLYSCLALGCLFETTENSTLDQQGYKGAIEQGVQYFKLGRQMIDITDCRDLNSLQTVLVMILFLQSSARLSTCYSYIGVALRAALRLGLHRDFKANFNPIELETRRRVFWTVRKMDGYVGALLGLPQMLNEEDIDQEYPTEVDDEYITAEGILPMPEGKISMMAGVNAHTKLIVGLTKVVKYIYPIKASETRQNSKFNQSSLVSHARIREIEKELQDWMENLPMELRPSEDATGDRARMQQLLRSSYAYVQMILYRPFLHYVRRNANGVDKRSYACAAACVSVSRNSIHITTQMKNRGLLTGAYWFSMFTTYFSILSLIYFVLENPDSQTSDELLKDAMEGKETLASLAKRSLAADRCTQSLNAFFEDLPEKIQGRKSVNSTPKSRKRAPSPNLSGNKSDIQSSNSLKSNQPFGGVQRAKTYPTTMDSQPTVRRSPSYAEPDSSKTQRTEHLGSVKIEASSASDSPNVPSAPSTDSVGSGQNVSPEYLASPGDSINVNATGMTFPDFSSMMFPSGDPFAYPNQPMSMLEDDQFRGDQINLGLADAKSNPFLQSNHSVPHPSYQGLHDPLFAPNFSFAMPNTMPASMTGYITPTSASSTTALPLATNRVSNPELMAMPAHFWQNPQAQQQQQPSQMMAPDMNIDDLISGAAGDWSGQSWMDTNTEN